MMNKFKQYTEKEIEQIQGFDGINKCKEFFKNFDKNNDNKIDTKELF